MCKMKGSGIEWIGNIPQKWVLKKIKNATEFISSGTTPASTNSDYYDGNVYWIQSGDIYGKSVIADTAVKVTELALKIPSLTFYIAPYIVMAMYGGSIGNTAISLIDACTNQACCCVKNDKENDLHFMYYWLDMCKDVFIFQAEGGGQPNISQTKIKNQYYVQPPLSEQEKIATYLDGKCSEIDALIADIKKQIETLEEYMRSVITEAVTKGLNPDVEMKDSGIEWIGKIPAHWNVDKIKFHLQRNEPRNPGDVPVLSLYRDLGIVLKDERDDNHNVTSEDTSNYKYVSVGDFVINKMKAWQGSVAVSKYSGIVSPAYYVYKFIDNSFLPFYFHHLIRSCYKDEFMRLSGGIRVGQWDLPAIAFENAKVIIPPINEQQSIAVYLDQKCDEIDSIIKDKKQQLETLAEYKKSLIYEYVTGKKEVLQ